MNFNAASRDWVAQQADIFPYLLWMAQSPAFVEPVYFVESWESIRYADARNCNIDHVRAMELVHRERLSRRISENAS